MSRIQIKNAMKLAAQLRKEGMSRKEAMIEAWKRVKATEGTKC